MKIIFPFIILTYSLIFSQDKLPKTFLKDLNSKKINIYDLHDNGPMAINFWFLACEPCIKEMKYLDQFHQKYLDDGFKVVSINTDNSRTLNRVKPFVNAKKYTFSVLSDPKSLFFRKLGGQQCPYLVLFDEHGNVVTKHSGYNPGDEVKLEKEILEIIENMRTKEEISDSTKLEIEVEDKKIESEDILPVEEIPSVKDEE